jgi:hypothetical protein
MPTRRRLRLLTFGIAMVILAQAGLGTVVNLYVAIPPRHPGAHPGNYLTGSFHSVAWALGSGAVALVVHAALGLALVVMVVASSVVVWRRRALGPRIWTTLGALMVVGAAFNGASFLDFNDNISSLLMSLLAFGAVGCYTAALLTS